MAFAITNKVLTADVAFIPNPGTHVELADQSATTAVQDLGAAYRNFKAFIYLKTDSGHTAVTFELRVDSAVGFGGTPTYVDSVRLNAPTAPQTVLLFGQTPLVAGYEFARIVVVGGDTIAFDAIIEAS